MFQSRLTEMDLTIDHARQDMQTGAIDHFASGICGERPDRLNASITNADIALTYTVMVDDGCTFQDRIKRLGHCCLLLAEWDLRAFSMRLT
ncbi:hypothetical protein D9M72_634760 [compost metagenome]